MEPFDGVGVCFVAFVAKEMLIINFFLFNTLQIPIGCGGMNFYQR